MGAGQPALAHPKKPQNLKEKRLPSRTVPFLPCATCARGARPRARHAPTAANQGREPADRAPNIEHHGRTVGQRASAPGCETVGRGAMTAFSVLDNVDDYEAGPGAVTRQTREPYSVTAGASGPGVGI